MKNPQKKQNKERAYQAFLDEQERKAWLALNQAKPKFFDTFDEYVAVYPDGEHWRHMVERKNGDILIAGYSTCLEGDYYIAWAQHQNSYKTGLPFHDVVINDGDDGYARKHCASFEEAEAALQELKQLAPFSLAEIRAFGFDDD